MNQAPSYADLEIRLLDRQDAGYPVEITLNDEQEFPRGYLDPGFLPWVPGASPAEDGRRLFEWFFADDRLKKGWAEVRGRWAQRRIRLRIDASAPELHAIPWELLRDPGDGSLPQDLAAAAATPFSRYLAGKWQPGSPIFKRPIRILVVIANPQNLADYDLSTLDVEAEWALLREAAAGLGVELARMGEPCTLAALEAELKKGYHVLHFLGHGSYSEKLGKAVLYMADPENRVVLVSDGDLAAMLARQLADTEIQHDDKLRLVFLAGCQTAARSPADAFRGLAPQLVAAGVPAVLAMQDLVPLDTAREFAHTFYRQLLQHGQVDLASNEARSALLTANLPGASIPVLFMRLRSGELLGRRGRISSTNEDMFWPFLLRKIYSGQCIPILGPRVNEGLLPGAETVAEKLADKYGYPLADRKNLVRVAQFMATKAPQVLRDDYLQLMQRSLFRYLGLKPTPAERQRFRNMGFSQTVEALNWAQKVLQIHENEIHHLLARLELPLYLTTNFDSFMVEALKYNLRDKGDPTAPDHRLPPRREGPRWRQAQVGSPQYVLSPEPSPDEPVVFHLNGHDGDPEQQHLILAEDDFLAHLVRISRDQDMIFPSNLLGEIFHEKSFLFLGYHLEDWEFRVILHGFLDREDTELHVAVQLADDQALDTGKAQKYLEDYFGQFSVDIYWGTPQQFVTELHTRWQQYLSETEQDEWDSF